MYSLDGGIGRRGRLRIFWWIKTPLGFKSPFRHHTINNNGVVNL